MESFLSAETTRPLVLADGVWMFRWVFFAYRSAADDAKATGNAFLAAPITLAQAEWQTSRLA
jgi:hypothetical protein